MDREVVWTNPAWDDVEEIADYIARDSAYYAAAFIEEMKETAISLSGFAERGQVVPEFSEESIRELLVRSYRLIYKISENRVSILAIIHCAQRPWRY
ncbi:MAG: type II toxin-antitoxin system RelE/ParE family toxin [Candidatus Latescibacter sp.]|nr:type II toxin-antitoxin system RelE/ParE family toxin [Candidatus Latescibacter sp.]